MFTDEHRRTLWDRIRQSDLRSFASKLTVKTFEDAALAAGAALGRGPLHLGNLVWLSLSCAMHKTHSFAQVLVLTLKLLRDSPDWSASTLASKSRFRKLPPAAQRKKHDPRRCDPTEVSEEAFVQARGKMPLAFWTALFVMLGERFEAEHDALTRWKGYRLLAMDGTCVNMPSWKGLTEHFGTSSNGARGRQAQARMVMLQLPTVRLPWRYELTPLKQGEKTVAGRLLRHLRCNDLVLMDRGFWSYGLFHQIADSKAFFGIRLFQRAALKTIRKLGSRDRLVRWTPTAHRWKKAEFPPSIELRVIDYQIKGYRASAVVTTVTDTGKISRDEWVGLATRSDPGRVLEPGLYHRRWSIETTFHELKVEQGMEGQLRSRTPEGIGFEIAGHVLLYLLVRWAMVEAAAAEGLEPLQVSFLNALRELQDMSQTLLTAEPERVRKVLLPRLLSRIAEHTVPERPGRHYPRPKDQKVKYKGRGTYALPSKLAAAKT